MRTLRTPAIPASPRVRRPPNRADTRRSAAALFALTAGFLIVAVSAPSAFTAPVSEGSSAIDAATNDGVRAVAHLSGVEEIPSVTTDASGTAVLRMSEDGTRLSYRLIVEGIDGVFQAHIHDAPTGESGPLVAFLLEPQPGGTGPVNGVLVDGSITASDLAGPLRGATLSDLADEISAGNIYVHVHTLAHPAGEIRGQME
jgi:hypothetical protein